VHISRPGTDGPNASGWYGRLRAQKLTGQKLTLSVLSCAAHLPGQSFHVWHFFDKIAPSSRKLWITVKPKRDLPFEFKPECSYFEHLVISHPKSDVCAEIVQSLVLFHPLHRARFQKSFGVSLIMLSGFYWISLLLDKIQNTMPKTITMRI